MLCVVVLHEAAVPGMQVVVSPGSTKVQLAQRNDTKRRGFSSNVLVTLLRLRQPLQWVLRPPGWLWGVAALLQCCRKSAGTRLQEARRVCGTVMVWDCVQLVWFKRN